MARQKVIKYFGSLAALIESGAERGLIEKC